MPEPHPLTTSQGDVYEVFASHHKDEPLHHIGRVIAPDVDLARTYAFTLYQEIIWNSIVIVPRREIVNVIEVV